MIRNLPREDLLGASDPFEYRKDEVEKPVTDLQHDATEGVYIASRSRNISLGINIPSSGGLRSGPSHGFQLQPTR